MLPNRTTVDERQKVGFPLSAEWIKKLDVKELWSPTPTGSKWDDPLQLWLYECHQISSRFFISNKCLTSKGDAPTTHGFFSPCSYHESDNRASLQQPSIERMLEEQDLRVPHRLFYERKSCFWAIKTIRSTIIVEPLNGRFNAIGPPVLFGYAGFISVLQFSGRFFSWTVLGIIWTGWQSGSQLNWSV